jgi:hypothetical protein
MIIKIEDILHLLVSRSDAPSSMGAQLDRLRFGLTESSNPFQAREDAEDRMLAKAAVLKAMSEFLTRQEFRGPNASLYRALEKIQRDTQPKLNQGYIAMGVLRAYQERATNGGQERALVEVYKYLGSMAPNVVPTPPKNEPDLVQAFRTGKAKRARNLAAETYADSLLALGQFLTVWNRTAGR